jgi:hypothetical protein
MKGPGRSSTSGAANIALHRIAATLRFGRT